MPSKIYWVHQFTNAARMGIMARPRGNEWLEEEVGYCKKQGVDIIVSLLERDEIIELGLKQEETLCTKHGIQFFNLPIKDRGLPEKSSSTEKFIQTRYKEILAGANIVIHCRMGIGRSSIIAGAIIQCAGNHTEKIISNIIKARGLTVPDTREQLDWLRQREKTRPRS